MSCITKVIVKTGQYKCISCLNNALEQLNLKGKIKVIQEREIFIISLSEDTEDYLENKIKSQLNLRIQRFHEQLLPI